MLKQSNLLEQLGVHSRASRSSGDFRGSDPTAKASYCKAYRAGWTYAPEPTLDDATYRHILKLCQGTGQRLSATPAFTRAKTKKPSAIISSWSLPSF